MRFQAGDTFTDVTDVVDELLAETATAAAVSRIREQMAEADRAHAMTLAMVRRAAGLTQAEIAKTLDVSQTAVARTEKRPDMLLSTLRAYIEATGAKATILVQLGDGRVAEISLEEAAS